MIETVMGLPVHTSIHNIQEVTARNSHLQEQVPETGHHARTVAEK